MTLPNAPEMIAYCGLICSACEAYLATRAGDSAALERLAAEAREQFGKPDITADAVACDGCPQDGGRLSGYCYECAVRACARERALDHCAQCADCGCAKLAAIFEMAPQAKEKLDSLRAS